MKPSDIYKLKSVRSRDDLYILLCPWHNHFPDIDYYDLIQDVAHKQTSITCQIYLEENFDVERCLVVGGAFLEGKPFMIFRHAGRGGHDAYDELVTDVKLYRLAEEFIKTLLKPKESLWTAKMDEDVPALDEFYGHQLFCEGKRK